MQKSADPQRKSRLSIRVKQAEKSILAQAARARRMNTSQFILQTSLDAAHAIIGEETEFQVSPTDGERSAHAWTSRPRSDHTRVG